MALENLVGPNVFITNLVKTNPTVGDPVSQGQGHLTGIKNVLLNTFPEGSAAITFSKVLQEAYGISQGPFSHGSASFASCGSLAITPKKGGSSILIFEAAAQVNLTNSSLSDLILAQFQLVIGAAMISNSFQPSFGFSLANANNAPGTIRFPVIVVGFNGTTSNAPVGYGLQSRIESGTGTVQVANVIYRCREVLP